MPTLLGRNAAVLVTMDGGRRELADAGLFARDGMIEQVGPDRGAAAECRRGAGPVGPDRPSRFHQHPPSPRPDDDAGPPRCPEHQPIPVAAGPLPGVGQPDAGGVAQRPARRAGRTGRLGVHDGVRPRVRLQERQAGGRPDRRGEGDWRALSRVSRLHVARTVEGWTPSGRLRRGRRGDSVGLSPGDRDVSRRGAMLHDAGGARSLLAVFGDPGAAPGVGRAARAHRVSCIRTCARRWTKNDSRSRDTDADRSHGWRRSAGWATTSGLPTRCMWTRRRSRSLPGTGWGWRIVPLPTCVWPRASRPSSGISPRGSRSD